MKETGAQQLLDISQQAVEAKEAGVAEVVRLLKDPEDLVQLLGLKAEFLARQKANKIALSNVVQSQVEAARSGLDWLDKSLRHTAKLRACLDRINQLCMESALLIDHHDRIRQLSITHANVKKVLSELGEIIDLPQRAEMVEAMLEDDASFLPAFEALTMLEGTSVNAKAAWTRNADARTELGDLQKYLQRVAEVMSRFEVRLWQHVANCHQLAEYKPTLLVDCIRVIELQERLDKQYSAARPDFKPKNFKSRMYRELEKLTDAKFTPLEAVVATCGQPNHKLRYDQWSNLIVSEERDYLGNLTAIVRVDKVGKPVPAPADEHELQGIDVIEEEIFDEGRFLDEVTEALYELLQELATVYDHVAPCFPPHYHLFETVFQLYHVHFAGVVDVVGNKATAFSTKGALRIMDWVAKYMETLRNLGVEEELVRLPVAPQSDPENKPGVVLLLDSYIERMETTVRTWYSNILAADVEYAPKQAKNGTLRTPGAVDFFRILNEEIGVIEGINDRGEVVLHTAQCALRIMRGFQAAQVKLLERPLSLEICCALLNNNIDCHDQSLEFADEVQSHLEEQHRKALDIEDACRGFLEVAKAAVRKLVEMVFNDPGLSNNVRSLFTSPEWVAGTVAKTIVATLQDYFNDFKVFVEPNFVKRIAEAALEELLRRTVNMFCLGLPPINPGVIERMIQDEHDFAAFFGSLIKPERAAKSLQLFTELRTIMTSTSVPAVVEAYTALVQAHARMTLAVTCASTAAAAAAAAAATAAGTLPAGFTPELLQKLLGMRTDLERKPVAEIVAQAREVWRVQTTANALAAAAARGETAAPAENRRGTGLFGRWGVKKVAATPVPALPPAPTVAPVPPPPAAASAQARAALPSAVKAVSSQPSTAKSVAAPAGTRAPTSHAAAEPSPAATAAAKISRGATPSETPQPAATARPASTSRRKASPASTGHTSSKRAPPAPVEEQHADSAPTACTRPSASRPASTVPPGRREA